MSTEPGAHPSGRDDLDQKRIDDLLRACAGNDEEASRHLFTLLYDDLKRVARRQLRSEHEAHTLGVTALVHETYLKFSGSAGKDWQGRAHFLAIASRAMRQVLVDHARRRGAEKRGGGQVQVTLSTDAGSVGSSVSLDVLALSEALDRLGERDERLVRLVECRFFGALTAEETAGALGVSVRTVERDWTRARLYLAHLLHPAEES
jgi:RNA polymerase sigma factor (TIGR02999 family)